MDFKKIKKADLVLMIKELKKSYDLLDIENKNIKCTNKDLENLNEELNEVNKEIFDKIKENDDYKQKFLELQDENINLVIRLNELKDNMNKKIQEVLNNDNDDTIKYYKKMIKQTQNKEKQDYINKLKKYIN